MMKGGKEEDKITGPLFPRLHVNDTDKGGPRAPPRNKMALYEQLSIPSQRFSSTTATTLPLPPQSASSQGNIHERSMFSPFYTPPSPALSAEKFHPCSSGSSDRKNLKSTRMEFEKRSTRHVNYKSANAAGSVAECSSLRPCDLSSEKNYCREKFVDEDDFRVPTFVHSENPSSSTKDTPVMERTKLTPFHASSPQKSCSATLVSSIQLKNSFNRPLEQTDTCALKSGKHEKHHNEQNLKDTAVVKEHREKSLSYPVAGEKLVETSKISKASSDQEHVSTINDIESTHPRTTGMCQESCGNVALDRPGCLNDVNVQHDTALRVRNESCSEKSPGNGHRGPNVADNCNREADDKASGSPELRDADRNDEVSETSMVDSLLGLEISPDDVVGVIGPKQFWKARRAIVNQQRVFALQVFELHRLLKVQKLIAASPHLLLEEDTFITPQKVTTKNLPSESNVKSRPQIVKHKDDSQMSSQNTESQTDKIIPRPLPSCDDGLNKGLDQPPNYGPYSGNPPPVPLARDNKPSPWCFHPPANQWLVPVMSPSEGLIYKPYAGHFPPTAGFMAPVYGACGSPSLPHVAGYGVPPSHPQQNMGVLPASPAIPPNYFPTPYGLPPANPIISSSAVEQVSPMTGARPNWQTEQHSRSSCNMPIPRSEAFSGRPWKFRGSKDSELQGSTASSPSVRAQGEGRDALPLFPMAPAVDGGSARPSSSQSHGKVHQTRVIKVVPHNARSATESAARIFRSIQEERQQFN